MNPLGDGEETPPIGDAGDAPGRGQLRATRSPGNSARGKSDEFEEKMEVVRKLKSLNTCFFLFCIVLFVFESFEDVALYLFICLCCIVLISLHLLCLLLL